MKKIVSFFMLAIMALVLVACGKDKPTPDPVKTTGVGYGLVHKHYVGVINVSLTDGIVTDASVEEYYLPYNWAKVAQGTADAVAVVGSRGTSYYAKYISVDGLVFTASATGESGSQNVVYAANGIANIEDWVKTEANAKRYVEAALLNRVFFASNAEGARVDYVKVDGNASKGWAKSTTGYWSGSNYPLGWSGNMAAFVAGIKNTKVDASDADLVQDEEKGTWSIGTIETTATMADFKDYYAVAKRAVANAKVDAEVVAYGAGYGLVHKHYVGIVYIKTVNGVVKDASVEEYYLPYNWAKVAQDTADAVAVVGSRGTSYYAKYISVDGLVFTASAVGESGSQNVVYAANGIADIEAWVKTEANAKRYVDAVNANKVFFASDAAGTKADYAKVDANASKGWIKSATGYWTGSNYPLGWAGNMKAFVAGIKDTKLDAVDTDLVQDEEKGTWSIGTIETTATMADFKDYYAVAKRALAAIK